MGTKRLDTLLDFARHHVDLEVICPRCDHWQRFHASDLMMRFRRSPAMNPRRLLFRCTVCGTRTAANCKPPR